MCLRTNFPGIGPGFSTSCSRRLQVSTGSWALNAISHVAPELTPNLFPGWNRQKNIMLFSWTSPIVKRNLFYVSCSSTQVMRVQAALILSARGAMAMQTHLAIGFKIRFAIFRPLADGLSVRGIAIGFQKLKVISAVDKPILSSSVRDTWAARMDFSLC